MKILRWILCCLLLCSPLVHAAQRAPSIKQAEKEAKKELKGKVVLLRGMGFGNMLAFDSQGNAFPSEASGPFAYSAVKIDKVSESDRYLLIKGNREAMVSQSVSEPPSLDTIRLIPLKEPVEIAITLDPSHPEALNTAIKKAFAFSLQDALADKPDADVKAALYSIASTAPPDEKSSSSVAESIFKGGIRQVGDGVSPPKLVHAVDPYYPKKLGKKRHIQGICVLSLVVDAKGIPNHIRVTRPLHPVLDMNAILAASQYRFEPAMYQGKPVPVQINVQVNFRIY